jgi:hypothetical protein
MRIPDSLLARAMETTLRANRAIEEARRVAADPAHAIAEYVATGREHRYQRTRLGRTYFDVREIGDDVPDWPECHEIGTAEEEQRLRHARNPTARDAWLDFSLRPCRRTGERRSERVRLLDDEGRPSVEAVNVVRRWAMEIVDFGSGLLAADSSDWVPTDAISAEAETLLRVLVAANGTRLTGKELTAKLADLNVYVDEQRISKGLVKELRVAGIPVESRRGPGGYWLVPRTAHR